MKRFFKLLTFISSVSALAQAPSDMKVSTQTDPGADEGEARIVINPNDSAKMVIGFMDVTATGVSYEVYTSSNGGGSWQASAFSAAAPIQTDFPGFIVAGGGDFLMAYDKTGKLYCTWIYLLANPTLANYIDSLQWVSYWATSTDNGQTFVLEPGANHFWGRGNIAYNTSNGKITVHNYADGNCDRDWLAVDLTNGPNANNLYVGYINYPYNTLATGLKVKTKTLSSTVFSTPATAYPGTGQLSNLLVDGNGVLHYSFADLASNTLYHVSSSDGAHTFSSPSVIAHAIRVFPDSAQFVNNRENAAPSLASDQQNNLFIVWNDFPVNAFPKAYYSKSTDGGMTWTAPLDLSTQFNGHVFMPTVSARNNRVSVSANILDNAQKSSYYVLSSSDNGSSFSSPVQVSSGVTDFGAIGKKVFVGDYSTSVRNSCTIYSAWTDARANGRKQYISRYNECSAMGIAEFSPVNSTFSLEATYPNPTFNSIHFTVNSSIADVVSIEIVNLLGQTVLGKNQAVAEGKSVISLDLDEISAGDYLLKLTNKAQDVITRLISKRN